MKLDWINGAFEFLGAAFYIINVLRLLRDKEVRGVSWLPQAFFTSWGFWNLFYYPSLGQWASFAGGVCLVLVNALWVALALYYGGFNGSHPKANGGGGENASEAEGKKGKAQGAT